MVQPRLLSRDVEKTIFLFISLFLFLYFYFIIIFSLALREIQPSVIHSGPRSTVSVPIHPIQGSQSGRSDSAQAHRQIAPTRQPPESPPSCAPGDFSCADFGTGGTWPPIPLNHSRKRTAFWPCCLGAWVTQARGTSKHAARSSWLVESVISSASRPLLELGLIYHIQYFFLLVGPS